MAAACLVLGVVAVPGLRAASACVGTDCMEIWSDTPDSGALTVYWDFVAHHDIQTFRTFCAAGECLYSTISPGFITTPEVPESGYYPLDDGTDVSIEILSIDPAATVRIDGVPLSKAGDTALLGTAPTLHNHPSWQLSLPEGELGTYPLSFKLTTGSSQYTESQVFSISLTNLATPTPDNPTPTATPTPTAPPPPACPGDCDGDGTVSVAEIVRGVNDALGGTVGCAAFDTDGSGTVGISELVAAVNAALVGCPSVPTPTAAPPVTLDEIQRTIFSPRCAIPTCHDTAVQSGGLVLDAAHAYAQLVGVAPTIDAARLAGLLRVDAGHPENSFLLVKLQGPPPDQGSRMPLTGTPLSSDEIALVRTWIAAGAAP